MNLDRIRLVLTLGYVSIFALTMMFLGLVTVFGFSRELVSQQDELLTQEAQHQTQNLLTEGHREVLSEGSDEFGWVALRPDGTATNKDPASSSLGLPAPDLARKALQNDEAVRGPQGSVRVVSLPMRDESGEVVGAIQYARSLSSVRETITGLLLVVLPLGIGALGISAVGGRYMARRAMVPVRESFERQRAFVADASHELKTPLTLIRANTEVLQEEQTDPENGELVEDVLAETDRMNFILSDLLLIARLEDGKLAVEREVFELGAVAWSQVDRFAARAASVDVEIDVETEGKLYATGDRERTGQILAVLLDNALIHTPPHGHVRITCRARKSLLEVMVEDTGPGIPPEHLPRVFERFYRADAARSRKKGGTGLGLAIARNLARAQAGDLMAENAKGGGAKFVLRLPAG